MTISVHFSIDVPDIVAGLRFHGAVFGFAEVARPFPTMAVRDAGTATLCLDEKPEGSAPARAVTTGGAMRATGRPVHLDLRVPALDPVLARIRAEGGPVEREFRGVGPKDVAFCSDSDGSRAHDRRAAGERRPGRARRQHVALQPPWLAGDRRAVRCGSEGVPLGSRIGGPRDGDGRVPSVARAYREAAGRRHGPPASIG